MRFFQQNAKGNTWRRVLFCPFVYLSASFASETITECWLYRKISKILPVSVLCNTLFTLEFSHFICSYLQIIIICFTKVEQNYPNMHYRIIRNVPGSNFGFSNYIFCFSPNIPKMNIRIIFHNGPRPLSNPYLFTVGNTFSFSFLAVLTHVVETVSLNNLRISEQFCLVTLSMLQLKQYETFVENSWPLRGVL